MKLMTFSVPKISDSPAATRNSSIPLISPPVVWVTRQEADVKHASIACRSKVYSRSGRAGKSRQRSDCRAIIRTSFASDVTHRLLPFRLVLQNGFPVTRRDLRHVRLLGNRSAPAQRVANGGLIFGAHCDRAVRAKRRLELHAANRFGQLRAVGGAGFFHRSDNEVHGHGVFPGPVGGVVSVSGLVIVTPSGVLSSRRKGFDVAVG